MDKQAYPHKIIVYTYASFWSPVEGRACMSNYTPHKTMWLGMYTDTILLVNLYEYIRGMCHYSGSVMFYWWFYGPRFRQTEGSLRVVSYFMISVISRTNSHHVVPLIHNQYRHSITNKWPPYLRLGVFPIRRQSGYIRFLSYLTKHRYVMILYRWDIIVNLRRKKWNLNAKIWKVTYSHLVQCGGVALICDITVLFIH